MSADLVAAVTELRKTTVTNTVHSQVYDAISPTRPELSQTGKTVLITGGGTSVGLGIATSFVHASASTVIIIGRRAEVLEQAKIQLEAAAKAAGTGTKILTRACDIANTSDADGLWAFLSQQNIAVDVFVSNAAKMVDPEPMMKQGFSEVWSQVEANLKAPMYFAEKFYKQGGERKKVGGSQFQKAPLNLRNHANNELQYIVNVTSAVIHAQKHPMVQVRPSYVLTKAASTLYFQLLAQDQPVKKLQVVSFHPGAVFNQHWAAYGIDKRHFDDGK